MSRSHFRSRQKQCPLKRPLRLEALEDRRLLAGVVVGNNLDIVNGNTTTIANLIAANGGDGISLREAILAANATAGADEITFAVGLSGQTITLGGTELTITEALTIDARLLAANVTINANQASRIINITATTGNFTLGGLTITGGRTIGNNLSIFDSTFSGGAIRSRTAGNLTLDVCTVGGNGTAGAFATGGGLFASGNVTIHRSTVNGNSTAGNNAFGGGLTVAGAATISLSTLHGNSATGDFADGGGIFAGSVSITQSTVSGNIIAGVNSRGAGIWSSGDVTLTQSTVSGNDAKGFQNVGGGIWTAGGATLTRSTVANNHASHATAMVGGVFQNTGASRPSLIDGSIVAGNVAVGAGADFRRDPSSALTVFYSVTGTGVAPTGGHDIVVTDNPQLGPLAHNGGPTQTHATLDTSLAINAGDPSILAAPTEFDQRGGPFLRVIGGRIDAGAYERQTVSGLNLVVDSAADENDGDYSAGDLSLREAIGLANGSVGANTITFAPAINGGTINLSLGELLISDALTINGPGANLLTIRAFDPTPLTKNADGSRIFNVDDGAATVSTVSISGLTLTGGDVAGHGGAILNRENLSIASSTISGNSAGGGLGGGLYNGGASAVLALNGVTVSNNLAGYGGGIMNVSGILAVTKSTISGNAVSGNGGGIQNNNGTLNVSQSTISGNNGAGAGGGVLSYYDVSTTLTNVTISGNVATQGGGLWARASNLNAAFTTITGNSVNGAFGSGGGVHLINPVSTTLDHTLVAGNIGALSPRDDIAGALTARFSLIGDNTGATITNVGGSSLIGTSGSPINPQLGPLANNGGLTQTRALLAGSPAINAGDPSIVFNPSAFDQRGAPFVRVSGGRIDIGAFELQPAIVSADFDSDGDRDGADFLRWQRGLGSTGAAATRANGNADNDNDVDAADLAIWQTTFGSAFIATGEPAAAAQVAAFPPTPLTPALVDAAMAYQQLLADVAPGRLLRPRLTRAR